MKYLFPLTVLCSVLGCSIHDDSEIIYRDTLKNKVIIDLEMRGGGATDIDVIWVKKIEQNEKNYIGKIKWYRNGFDCKIWQANDSIIKVRLTDTSSFKGMFRDFTINLNNKIYFNDGSMFADSTY